MGGVGRNVLEKPVVLEKREGYTIEDIFVDLMHVDEVDPGED